MAVVNSRHVRTLFKLAIVAAMVTLTGFARQPGKPLVVYHDDARMLFTPQATGTLLMAKLGRWDLGERLKDEEPRDKRLNLYVVFPGRQYRSLLHSKYNHTLIINKYTVDGRPREWDVFWCLVLDPSLHRELRSERDLLVAAHETFRPARNLKFRRIPSHAVLAEQLDVKDVRGLHEFRRKDGSLPRLLIIPAHLAVRAITTKSQQRNEN